MKRILLVAALLLSGALGAPGSLLAQTDVTCQDIAPEGAPASYFVGLGDAYFAQANHTLTIVAYTCAIDLDAAYAPAFVHRGYAYAVQGAILQAMDDYNRALALDETLLSAYNNRGMLYVLQGNFGLALTDFELAAALDPNFAAAIHNRGLVHAIEGRYDAAIADFQQALVLDPAFAAPYASLGAVYSALALQSYQQYQATGKRLPGGQPDDILNAIDSSLETGDFSIWTAFLTPAQ